MPVKVAVTITSGAERTASASNWSSSSRHGKRGRASAAQRGARQQGEVAELLGDAQRAIAEAA